MEDIDDKVFDALIQEKRFTEIVEVLKQILSNLKPDQDVSSVKELLDKIIINQASVPKSITTIADVISTKLDIIVQNQEKNLISDKLDIIMKNQNKNDIGTSIISKLDTIASNQNKDWNFDIKRGSNGLISNVIAKQV